METPPITDSAELDFQLKSQASTFLTPNGINSPFPISDIEMVALQSLTYTSLKDLLPASTPGIMSPTYSRNQSWLEIPIKNPLVKHAAWAYLQPMSSAPESDDRNCFLKLKDKFYCECGLGCAGFINGVVFPAIKRALGRVTVIDRGGDTENDDDDTVVERN